MHVPCMSTFGLLTLQFELLAVNRELVSLLFRFHNERTKDKMTNQSMNISSSVFMYNIGKG